MSVSLGDALDRARAFRHYREDRFAAVASTPGLMVGLGIGWLALAGLLGLALPVGRLVGAGQRSYHVAMTAHAAAVVFPGVFQFMIGLSLLKTGTCRGRRTRRRLATALVAALNGGALLYAAAVLLGGRWSYVLMFPLPLVGAEQGLWSHGVLRLGVVGLGLMLLATIVLYPLLLVRTMYFGEGDEGLVLSRSTATDPGMLAMAIGVVLLVVPGLPLLATALGVAGTVFGVAPEGVAAIATDATVFQYAFWLFSHNLMEAMGIMTLGAVYFVVPQYTHGGEGLYSDRMANLALVFYGITAFSSFFHHLYTTAPINPAALSYHGQAMSWGTALGGALSVFTVLATVAVYGVKRHPAAFGVLAGFGLYILDGTAAAVVSTVSWNEVLHGTMFVSGHAMTILTAVALVWVGVLYHYYPAITGRLLDARLQWLHVAGSVVGAVGLYYVFVVMGADGVPRRFYPWPDGVGGAAIPVLLFGAAFGAAQLAFLVNVGREGWLR